LLAVPRELGYEGVGETVQGPVVGTAGGGEGEGFGVASDICVAVGQGDDRGSLVVPLASQVGGVVQGGAVGAQAEDEGVLVTVPIA
jgi:hypothetical protein